jgi:hypothetical protein
LRFHDHDRSGTVAQSVDRGIADPNVLAIRIVFSYIIDRFCPKAAFKRQSAFTGLSGRLFATPLFGKGRLTTDLFLSTSFGCLSFGLFGCFLLFASSRACSRADNFFALGSFLAVLGFDFFDRSFFADLESLADDFFAERELVASLRLASFFLTSAFADAVGFFAVLFFLTGPKYCRSETRTPE